MSVPATNRFAAAVLVLGGFIAWSLAFTVMYAVLSFGCAYGWDAVPLGPVSLNRAALTGAWVLCLVALAALLYGTIRLTYAPAKGVPAFLRRTGVALTALALAATAANFFMVSTMSTCL